MSWDHIHFTAKAIMAHKSFVLENIFSAISAGLGGKKGKGKSPKRKPRSKMTPEQKDASLINQIRGAGLRI